MLLDVRYLIELLRSPSWSWVRKACEDLLAAFGLREVEAVTGRRAFRSDSGLRAVLISGPDGTPTAIAFPFRPDAEALAAGAIEQYAELIAMSVTAVLGEPSGDMGAQAYASWTLASTRVSVQVDRHGSPWEAALLLEPLPAGVARAS